MKTLVVMYLTVLECKYLEHWVDDLPDYLYAHTRMHASKGRKVYFTMESWPTKKYKTLCITGKCRLTHQNLSIRTERRKH